MTAGQEPRATATSSPAASKDVAIPEGCHRLTEVSGFALATLPSCRFECTLHTTVCAADTLLLDKLSTRPVSI